ncbi:MAG: energy transducer TonB [Acidobacteria bacterium]|nr:energy transducer TonB [Acidobacteriota bacterium]MBV9186255.1 energy transducer TonB [Acidobacteriota bacterium]
MSIHTRTMIFALLVSGFMGTASAATGNWQTEVNQSAATLRSGNYSNSLKVADQILSAMVERLGADGADDTMLATALTHKALANAGLGKINEALWYWYIAQEISPAIARTDLSAFGAPGEFLKRHPFTDSDASPSGRVTPARIVKQVVPKFPPGASRFGIGGDLVVQIVIDKNGQPTLPRIVHALPAPTLSFVALEALKHWQFEPARQNGEPVPIVFDLTVHYKL